MLIPRPVHREEEPEPLGGPTKAFTNWYLGVPNWVCPECIATMFGRMKYCIYCKQRLGKDTLRPADMETRDEWNREKDCVG